MAHRKKKGYVKKRTKTKVSRRRSQIAARDRRLAKSYGLSVSAFKKKRAAERRKRKIVERFSVRQITDMLTGKSRMDPQLGHYLRGAIDIDHRLTTPERRKGYGF